MTVDEAIQYRDQHVNHHRRERAIAERIAETLFRQNLLRESSGSRAHLPLPEHEISEAVRDAITCVLVSEIRNQPDQHVNHHRRERAIAERIAKALFENNLLTVQDSGSLTTIKDAEHIATRILVEATDTRDRHGERQIALWIADTLFRHGLTMGDLSCLADIITAVLVADSQEREKRPATPMGDYSGAERVPQIPLIPDQLADIRLLMKEIKHQGAEAMAQRVNLSGLLMEIREGLKALANELSYLNSKKEHYKTS